jgi:uncharacterized glyoxalase superfamily protein PhnB
MNPPVRSLVPWTVDRLTNDQEALMPVATIQSVFPTFRYEDARAAIAFLTDALGFSVEELHEDGGRIVHAELEFSGSRIMLGGEPAEGDGRQPYVSGPSTTYVVVEDADAAYARAKAAGATIAMELTDQDYGSRDFAVLDPGGNRWSLGTYRPA